MMNSFLCYEVILGNSSPDCILVYPTAWNIVSNFMLLSVIQQWTFLAVNLCLIFFLLSKTICPSINYCIKRYKYLSSLCILLILYIHIVHTCLYYILYKIKHYFILNMYMYMYLFRKVIPNQIPTTESNMRIIISPNCQ